MKNLTQYYHELGKLAYALVLSDAEIHGETRHQLHDFIAKKMHQLELENNLGGIHEASKLEFDFSQLDRKKTDPLNALISYKNFIGKNFEDHDEDLIQKGMYFLEQISDEYHKQHLVSEPENFEMNWKTVGAKIEH